MGNPPRERLDKALSRVATALDLDQQRLRTWVSFIAICGVLERAVAEGVLDDYHIKGGVALELRFFSKARASGDIDIAIPGDLKARLAMFDAAIALGFDRFRVRRKGMPKHLEIVDTVRLMVAIEYDSRPVQSIDVDLGPGGAPFELVVPDFPGLHDLGVPTPSTIRCLTLEEQVAQKIHGATNPAKIIGKPKLNRARDILDVLLIELLGQADRVGVRAAAERLFASETSHAWPPKPVVYPKGWCDTLEALARELDYPVKEAAGIISAFERVVGLIANAEESDE